MWADISGYKGRYAVSDDGRVINIRTLSSIALIRTKYGHLWVSLWKDGKYKAHFVHRLVLETFVGPCPPGMQCRHKDGNPSNNHVYNLKWGTPKQNAKDRNTHGRTVKGVRFWSTKLNPRKVRRARHLRNKNPKRFTIKRLARMYHIARSSMRAVLIGNVWKSV